MYPASTLPGAAPLPVGQLSADDYMKAGDTECKPLKDDSKRQAQLQLL